MSTPAHLWLTDEKGALITGACLIPSRLGSIELRLVRHNVTIAADAHSGKLTGTRLHSPIIIQKEFDRTTPLLFRALCQGRTFTSAVIKMYRIIDSGMESEYFNMTLEKVKITAIAPSLFPGGTSSTHIEDIALRYESIAWKYVDGNIFYKDAWNEHIIA